MEMQDDSETKRINHVALFGCACLCGGLIIAIIVIPISLTVTTETHPACKYYTKDGCLSSCGCNWCNISVCTSDISQCKGAYTVYSGDCPPNYTGFYAAISIVSVPILFGLCICSGFSFYAIYRHLRRLRPS